MKKTINKIKEAFKDVWRNDAKLWRKLLATIMMSFILIMGIISFPVLVIGTMVVRMPGKIKEVRNSNN